MTDPNYDARKYGSRRFILAAVAMALTAALAFAGKMTVDVAFVFSVAVGGHALNDAWKASRGGQAG